MVTPLTQKYFNFGELENSVMYCICGVEVIAGFLFVRWLTKRAAERVVLAVGLILCNISCVWCLIFLANPQGEEKYTGVRATYVGLKNYRGSLLVVGLLLKYFSLVLFYIPFFPSPSFSPQAALIGS